MEVKHLWLWLYHTGQPNPRGTTGRIELFYCLDEAEARAMVEERVKEIEPVMGEVFEEELRPISREFILAHSYFLPSMEVDDQGNSLESPIKKIEPH